MDTLKNEINNINNMKQQILYKTTEGKILWIGIFLTVLLIGIIIFYGIIKPEESKILTLVFFAHTFGGRAAGVGLCIMEKLDFFTTLIYNFFIEIQLLTITYSIFVLAITNYIKIPWVLRIANDMRDNADKHKDKIAKYGWIGIFLFVLAPFPGSGPVGGSILGYLLKMRLLHNFSAVLSGTFLAILLWVLCFDFLKEYLYIIQYIIAAIIIFVLFSHFNTIKNWFTNKD